MTKLDLYSDQLLYWSECYEKSILQFTKKEKEKTSQGTTLFRKSTPWLVDRALQTLWKIQLQMFSNSRAWTEILFIHKSNKISSGNGLCSPKLPETSYGVCTKLPQSTGDSQRDLWYQPRTSPSERMYVGTENDRSIRHRRCGYPFWQYAQGLFSTRFSFLHQRKGGR